VQAIPDVRRPDFDVTETTPALSGIGGEFLCAETEARFLQDQAKETFRHANLVLIACAILNTLFLASDWRFAGTPHFWVAVPARLVTVGIALASVGLLRRHRTPQGMRGVLVGWMLSSAAAVSAMVTSHSSIALLVVIMLPSIYYLLVPVGFRWTLICGLACSAMLLVGYALFHEDPHMVLGLTLTMALLNTALAMIVSRSNRLARLAWAAIGAERRAKDALADGHAMLQRLFSASPVPIVVSAAADGRIITFNDSWLTYMGSTAEELRTRSVTSFYVRAADREELVERLARDGAVDDFELEVRTPDGTLHTVVLRAKTVDAPEGPIVITGILDISDRKAAERRMAEIAATDMLTGLSNRLSFFTAAGVELARAQRSGAPMALLMVDLDHFKQINDGFGHQGGDEALRAFAGVCRTEFTRKDVIGRLGGEEFAIMLPQADLAQAIAVAERLRRAVAELRLAPSIGVSEVRPHEDSIEAVIAFADAALYKAKRDGRNRVVAAPAGRSRSQARRRHQAAMAHVDTPAAIRH